MALIVHSLHRLLVGGKPFGNERIGQFPEDFSAVQAITQGQAKCVRGPELEPVDDQFGAHGNGPFVQAAAGQLVDHVKFPNDPSQHRVPSVFTNVRSNGAALGNVRHGQFTRWDSARQESARS